jgi:CLIP-associating protein 1/2
VQLRRAIPTFPLRPFLSPLVQILSDSDATVRDCSRKSIISIFSAPGVAEAAKADLKREMEKQLVRKPVVAEILAGVIGGHSSETPEARIPLPPSKLSTSSELNLLGDFTGQSEISEAAVTRNEGDIPAVYVSCR